MLAGISQLCFTLHRLMNGGFEMHWLKDVLLRDVMDSGQTCSQPVL